MLTTKLENRRIAVLVADGFEKIELTLPVKAMKVAGATVEIISLHRGKIRGMNLHKPASKVSVTKTVKDARPDEYDALFIPGGFINPDLLRQSAEARNFVKSFALQSKPIASLCHGPWLLASANLLTGRKVTSWPGIRDDMVNAGAIWLNHSVVIDGNLVTSRGPQDLMAFVPAVLSLFSAEAELEKLNRDSDVSDQQANEPSQIVQKTIGLIPNLPFKWMAGLAMVALGGYALASGKRVALG